MGSGKGRALVAAALPFRRIVGVEFSPELEELARANVERFMRKSAYGGSIESVCEDATAYDLPPEPLVLHFFNPFEEPVMRDVRTDPAPSKRDRVTSSSCSRGEFRPWSRTTPPSGPSRTPPAGLFWATPAT